MGQQSAASAMPPDLAPENPHALPADQVLARMGVGLAGLTEAESERRRLAFGPNTIAARRTASALAVLLHQFLSPMVYLLAAAAALALAFGELEEVAAIVVVLLLNAAIGFLTEIRAVRSLEALRALGTHAARVRRDGHVRVIPAEEMVPGDVVLVEAGDRVSADLRLVEASGIATDESTLTGESVAVEKSVAPVPAGAPLAERGSMLFKGTTLTRGAGVGVAVATGLGTELGRISRLVEEASPEESPLERQLARLSSQMIWAVVSLAVVIAGVGLLTGKDAVLMVQAAIALAVAAIPEGLPIVATLVLARGMWRMARQNALIERLSAVETLGATTVILTDKTGTLTENRMAVRRLVLSSGEMDVTPGAGDGAIPLDGDRELSTLIETAVRCNDASLESGEAQGSGDPMELALLRLGLRAGLSREALLDGAPKLGGHAFDSVGRMMASMHRRGADVLFAVKGAPEQVLAAATRELDGDRERPLVEARRAHWLAAMETLGREGLRVLACAVKTGADPDALPYEDLVFAGLIGLEDPARADVPAAIADCHRAGIRVVMVTGDHLVTARSIGRAVGLARPPATASEACADAVAGGRAVADLLADGEADGGAKLRDVRIFARVSPAEKLALVKAYQACGEVVAMTGDGVNDAPALKQADIGVAMGLRGTDVARQAAAMVLLDDAFPSIVRAIREGRVIFANIRRFVAYLLACNISEVLVVGLAVLSTLPLPVLPLQILYLNLVTDVFPAFALAMGEGEKDVLDRPPRDPREPILGPAQWATIVLQSLALTAGTFGALAGARLGLGLAPADVVTVTFLTLAFAQLFHVFNMRGSRSGVVRNEVTANPWVWAALLACSALLVVPPHVPVLAGVLNLTRPTPAMWALVLAMSLAPLVLIQAGAALRAALPARRRP